MSWLNLCMPDNEDHERWIHMLRHPEEWSPQNREQMASSLHQQRDILRVPHPKDAKGRARLKEVRTQIEVANAGYDDLAFT